MIRDAVVQDIPILSELTAEGRRNAYRLAIDIPARERFDAHTTPEQCKNVLMERMHQEGAQCLVYELSGKVVGFILGNVQQKRITFLFVGRSQVGKGIGSALLRKFLDANLNIRFSIEVVKRNTKAIDLYEKFGFQVIGEKSKLYFGLEKIEMQL